MNESSVCCWLCIKEIFSLSHFLREFQSLLKIPLQKWMIVTYWTGPKKKLVVVFIPGYLSLEECECKMRWKWNLQKCNWIKNYFDHPCLIKVNNTLQQLNNERIFAWNCIQYIDFDLSCIIDSIWNSFVSA